MFTTYLFVIVFSLIGLVVTATLHIKKRRNEIFKCPFDTNCHAVTTSSFSKFLGINLEILGIIYYSFILIIYLLFLFFPPLVITLVIFITTGITIGGFLFSLYLIFVQAFLIKSWCTWCLISATSSIFIFLFNLINLLSENYNFSPFFIEYKEIIMLGYLLGILMGVSGTTAVSLLFIRFIKDFKITKQENEILETFSQFTGIGLFIVLLFGIGLYLPNMEVFKNSPENIAEITILIIIVINYSFSNLVIFPKLVSISLKKSGLQVKKIKKLVKYAFAYGSVSFVSWYSLIILKYFSDTQFDLHELLEIYLAFLLIGIFCSQIAENSLRPVKNTRLKRINR
jgi:uncharacterized membrane protein